MSPGNSSVSEAGTVVAALAGGALVLGAVMLVLVGMLIRRYRSECHQLRERNRQLSIENDRWHEDFAAQAGELTGLRRDADSGYGRRARPGADVS